MEENNLTTTRLVKEFTHGMSCRHLEWNERTQYLASGGDQEINVNNLFIDIWSTHHDRPIYSLKFLLQDGWKKFAWRLCTGNGEEKGGIEMARKSAKNFAFAYPRGGDLNTFFSEISKCNLKFNERSVIRQRMPSERHTGK
ncbi:Uncharacterized protein APZ42_001242 [Daphnia magna]|uniref:Uncharacterized protein n=1 Tax=Daphnia magna TaxID=35525 RepID=A0A164J3L6_9CRUS|nr:Uncharacterized protein APZ42_001242 [Daphnia magna]